MHGGVYGAVPLSWAYCGKTRLPGSRGQRGSHTQGSIRARSFLCDPPIPSLRCPEDLELNRCINWCPANTYGPTKGILSLGTKVAAHGVMTAATLATREHKDPGAEPGGVDVGTGCAACPSRTPTARRPHWPPLFLLSKAVASQFPKLPLSPCDCRGTVEAIAHARKEARGLSGLSSGQVTHSGVPRGVSAGENQRECWSPSQA